MICRVIVEMDSRFRHGQMYGIVLGYEDCDQDDKERSITVSERKWEYHRNY